MTKNLFEKEHIHSESTRRKIGDKLRGGKHTLEFSKQVSERMKKLWQNPEYRAKNKTSGGRKRSAETKRKMSEAHFGKSYNISLEGLEMLRQNAKRNFWGRPPWNRGLTIADERIRRGAIKDSIIKKQKWQNPEYRELMSKVHKGKQWNEVTKQKQRAYWRNPEWLKKMQQRLHIKPNAEELYLDAILQLNFPNEWKYTGDFAFWIEGRNPDWVNCNGKKIVIEYNGYRRSHTLEKDKLKTEHYAKYGFETINIYPNELKEDIVVKIIRRFGVE